MPLSFDYSNLERVTLPHDDALIITLQSDVYNVKHILVDTRSPTDIIFEYTFSHMGISKDQIKPISLPLYDFTGASAPVDGIIPLTVITGVTRLQAAQTIAFLTLAIEDHRDEQTIKRVEPVEDLISIPLEGDKERQLRISPTLEPTLCNRRISFLCSNMDVFAWSAANMPRTAECQASFKALKDCLASPPLLSKPIVGEELFLYLAVADSSVSNVLIRDQDGKQLPIYYVSKVLQGAKLRYPNTSPLLF
ncbi:hypothetical protein RJ639_002810 [Escallonia herrerae]|uniref:Reverse transcriptase/retrotransposon-derived protein RNase H-like domain-containing protein n=1 Tax=Escallonia herrerae TaxID=1293975 RepID=A0AA88W3H1_9ASTE|nr:hypothetical protein RJ639_002810 [Escallonia herrerae]